MTFHSILFGEGEGHLETDAPVFFVDLNLDQVIDAVTAGKQEYDLKPFFCTALNDIDLIRYRQEVMRDLENAPVLEGIKAFADRMRVVRRYLAFADKLEYKYHKEGWFLEAAIVYGEAVKALDHDLERVKPESRGLAAFRDYVTAYARSDAFTALLGDTAMVKADLTAIRYGVVVGLGWVRVRRYESEIDYSQEVERTFEKFKQGVVKDYRAKLPVASGMNHVEAQILDFVAKLHREIFLELDAYSARHSGFVDDTIRVFDREIQFYVAYQGYIAGIKSAGLAFCYPQLSRLDKAVEVCDSYDLALANKRAAEGASIVCNDFYLQSPERVFVVSGPNQGGKTTFARMVGQLLYLASLGCPVPGREARLFLPDRIFTHFEKEEDIQNLRGKLQDDLVRIHAVLSQATPASLIILNEIFTSTTVQDAVFLSRQILGKILELDALCVCVTFLDELATLSEKTVSVVSTVAPENPAVRTFKIVRKPADGLAYALSVAEKYRLTYDLLRRRLRA